MGSWVDVGHWLRIYQAHEGSFTNEICISAHGGYMALYGHAEIPDPAKVYLYELHGSTQDNERARDIMRGKPSKITGLVQGGRIFDYHLSKFEEDLEQVPADVNDAVQSAASEARLRAGPSGAKMNFSQTIVRDVLSVRNRKQFGAKWAFGVPLSYVFKKVSGVHKYHAYHLCFCRYVVGGWKYNVGGKQYVRD